jgi:hypothetical protein
VFISELGAPFTTARFAPMVERAARHGLGLEPKAHAHMFAVPARPDRLFHSTAAAAHAEAVGVPPP